MDRIQDAYQRVAAGKRVVLAEGTGHPGVGSVGGISNADVINLLRGMGVPLSVLLVTRGGIGATIDQVFPYLVLLDHMHVRVEGMIVNGVYPSKMDKIRRYLVALLERCQFTARCMQHPLADPAYLTGFLGKFDEAVGAEPAQVRVIPTKQCLHADGLSRFQVDFWLEHHLQFSAFHRPAQACLLYTSPSPRDS